jgi:hypothetical protein
VEAAQAGFGAEQKRGNTVTDDLPWLYLTSELKRDAVFFVPCGAVFGLVQLVSYDYFKHADWGIVLACEHIAFNSLALIVAGLALSWLAYRLRAGYTSADGRLAEAMRHVAGRAQALASPAACVLTGFTVVAAVSGAGFELFFFVLFILYLVTMGELAANVWRDRPWSRSLRHLLPLAVVTPFIGLVAGSP